MRVFITGDTHGDFRRIQKFCEFTETTKDDILVVLGDAGINYYLGKRDESTKEFIQSLPITLFCIHGNHECRPANIKSYKEENFLGGIVYKEKKYPNILFAKDGEVFNFLGNQVLVIGGAYSVDKFYRLAHHYAWYEDEQPSEEVKQYVESQIKKYHYKFDYIFSHTCPLNVQPRHLFLYQVSQSEVDNSTENWLQYIADNLSFKEWFFGHYHSDWNYDNYTLLFQSIVELNKKEDSLDDNKK